MLRITTALFGLAATALALVGPTSARAATTSPSSLFSVQVGVGQELSSSAKNTVASTTFHAGASLNLGNGNTLFVLPGEQGIDFDYDGTSGHGGHINAYGLTYANRIDLIPKVAQAATLHIVPYVGFGIGAFRDDVRTQTTVGTTTTTLAKTDTHLGGKLMAGVGFGNGAFLEVSYILSGTAANVRTDSINLSIGTHL